MMLPSERYKHDPVFRGLVNTLRSLLVRSDFTPSELREAVLLAATMYETETIRPLYRENPDGSFTVWERGKR